MVELAEIVAALELHPANAQLIARLCQLAHNHGDVVANRLTALNLPVAQAFPNLNPRPLFFVHIPKTAGASVHQFLDSQFDEEHIFPGWNRDDLRETQIYSS